MRLAHCPASDKEVMRVDDDVDDNAPVHHLYYRQPGGEGTSACCHPFPGQDSSTALLLHTPCVRKGLGSAPSPHLLCPFPPFFFLALLKNALTLPFFLPSYNPPYYFTTPLSSSPPYLNNHLRGKLVPSAIAAFDLMSSCVYLIAVTIIIIITHHHHRASSSYHYHISRVVPSRLTKLTDDDVIVVKLNRPFMMIRHYRPWGHWCLLMTIVITMLCHVVRGERGGLSSYHHDKR